MLTATTRNPEQIAYDSTPSLESEVRGLLEPATEALLTTVPLGRQARSLSCEFQSASDLAWFYGKAYTWEEIFQMIGHDPSGNPHKGFVGSSLDGPPGRLYPEGYGVYAEPIARALQSFGLAAQVRYMQTATWLKQQISTGRPVMVWATANMRPATIENWKTTDGTLVEGARGEHTYLVVGYTPKTVWVLDPWEGERREFSWEVFLEAWDIFNRMSVTIAD